MLCLCSRLRRLEAALCILLTLTIVIGISPASIKVAAADKVQVVEAPHGVVVSVSQPASDVGRDVLRQGGNAVDAAIATAFALAVTYPPAGNIGGGGFMMVHPSDDRPPVCVEYRETAPEASSQRMFQLGESRHTHKIVGVPGTVRGMELAHREFGSVPWKELVMPAVALARDGFVVNEELAAEFNRVLSSEPTEVEGEFRRVFAPPRGAEWRSGDRLVQPDLARTLAAIAEQGADAFYIGPVADLLVEEMVRGGGLISRGDLERYRARLRPPIRTRFRGYDVLGPPPPSSGGITLGLMLNILDSVAGEKIASAEPSETWPAETAHLMIESMRRAYLARAKYLGDPDFTPIPRFLTQRDYAAELARDIDPEHATPSEELAGAIPLAGESEETTHFSVVDGSGMAVSNTYTLEGSFGSHVVVRGGGFLLNNEMGDFNWKPGHTDRRGNIGTIANQLWPGKRMLSSQCPTIVARNGKVRLVTGSPGGRTIINTVLCVTLNVIAFERPLDEAVAFPRMHHQWLPDIVRLEGLDEDATQRLAEALRDRGHSVEIRNGFQGDAHSIVIDPMTNMRIGVADYRRGGGASGY